MSVAPWHARQIASQRHGYPAARTQRPPQWRKTAGADVDERLGFLRSRPFGVEIGAPRPWFLYPGIRLDWGGGRTRQARRAVATDSEGSGGGHGLVAWEKVLTAGPRLPEGVRPHVVRRAGQKWMRAATGQGPHMPVSRAIAGVRLG
jgi:hypothetical protein